MRDNPYVGKRVGLEPFTRGGGDWPPQSNHHAKKSLEVQHPHKKPSDGATQKPDAPNGPLYDPASSFNNPLKGSRRKSDSHMHTLDELRATKHALLPRRSSFHGMSSQARSDKVEEEEEQRLAKHRLLYPSHLERQEGETLHEHNKRLQEHIRQQAVEHRREVQEQLSRIANKHEQESKVAAAMHHHGQEERDSMERRIEALIAENLRLKEGHHPGAHPFPHHGLPSGDYVDPAGHTGGHPHVPHSNGESGLHNHAQEVVGTDYVGNPGSTIARLEEEKMRLLEEVQSLRSTLASLQSLQSSKHQSHQGALTSGQGHQPYH